MRMWKDEEAKKKDEETLKKKAIMWDEAQTKAEEIRKKEGDPIKFKDAVGRKFSFPFHLTKTWTVSF